MVQVVEQQSDENVQIIRKKVSKNKKNKFDVEGTENEIDLRKSLSVEDAEDIIMSRFLTVLVLDEHNARNLRFIAIYISK